MHGSTQHNDEENAQELARTRRKYNTLFIVKCGLGILLLVLGGVAHENRKGQWNTFGPPYFLGAFIVGCAMVLAGLTDLFMYRNFNSNGSAALKKIPQYTSIEVILTGIAIIGGLFGIFFVAMFGIPECDPSDFFSHCNYTDNLSTNRNLAKAILISLLVSEIIAVGSIVIHCLVARQQRFNTRQNVYFADRAGNVVMTTAREPRPFAESFGHNRNYDSYSADTQIITGGHVTDKNRNGFSGAVIHPPQNTVIRRPMEYPQHSGAFSPNTQYIHEGQGHTIDESVNNLQEQNRLLREQIELQQQQLQLLQQQQRHQQSQRASSSSPAGGSSSPAPPAPPPSYESCLQYPDQNQSQREQIKMPPSEDRQTAPSAPPM